MTDLVLVDCYLPQSPVTQNYFSDVDRGTAAAGLMISVSNDGEHKSVKNLTFLSYDSACMTCNISSGCFFKASLFNLSLENQNEINPSKLFLTVNNKGLTLNGLQLMKGESESWSVPDGFEEISLNLIFTGEPSSAHFPVFSFYPLVMSGFGKKNRQRSKLKFIANIHLLATRKIFLHNVLLLMPKAGLRRWIQGLQDLFTFDLFIWSVPISHHI